MYILKIWCRHCSLYFNLLKLKIAEVCTDNLLHIIDHLVLFSKIKFCVGSENDGFRIWPLLKVFVSCIIKYYFEFQSLEYTMIDDLVLRTQFWFWVSWLWSQTTSEIWEKANSKICQRSSLNLIFIHHEMKSSGIE